MTVFIIVWILSGFIGFGLNTLDDFVIIKKGNKEWRKGPVADTIVSFLLAMMFGPLFLFLVVIVLTRSYGRLK